MLYLITYDLVKPKQDYDNLYEAIKQSSSKWWHYLDSTWLIVTELSIDDCVKKIHATMDDNDKLLIVDITRTKYNGWLPKKAWEWISANAQE